MNKSNSDKKISILFRNTIPEIPSTTFGTFAIYKYPAKFIPQVIAYVLKEYARPGMTIFDPFGGYGTVGVVSRVYGYNYELWDLNPLINTIHDTAIIGKVDLNVSQLLQDIKNSKVEFLPTWSNLAYWFTDEFMPVLAKTWGFVNSLPPETKAMFLIPLIKTTRYFSYSDEKVHKLYKSKQSKQKVLELLQMDWQAKFYGVLKRQIETLIKKIEQHSHLNPKSVEYRIRSGVDVLETNLEREVNIMVTSPPYLQAQEYIRSTKLELFWLGYNEEYIRELGRKEIPYRKVKEFEIHSETYHRCRAGIMEEHLKELYDRYFYAILTVFSNLSENVTDYMTIFVGPAQIRITAIPIDDIIVEHLQTLGWQHEVTFVDTIVGRSMFQAKINPASGFADSRMKTEHLVVMKRQG